MAWSTHPSQRRVTLPADWPKICKRILKRDAKRCQWGSLEEDHAAYGMCDRLARETDHKRDPLDHSDDNLRALCTVHHQKRSAMQGAKASADVRRARVAARKQSPDRHPGLLSPEELLGPGDPEAYSGMP